MTTWNYQSRNTTSYTDQSKNSTSWTMQARTGLLSSGSPIGLLLVLTHAETTGTGWTYQTKN